MAISLLAAASAVSIAERHNHNRSFPGSPREEPTWSRPGPAPSSPPLDASLPTWFELEERGPREEATSGKGEFIRLQGNYTDSPVFPLFL